MRRLVVLGLLLGLMSLLQTLQEGGETAIDLSLATFGFVLLAAYTLGQVASSAGLPKITGYIITGLFFGPQILNVFSEPVAEDLRVVNDLAIGLIALGAGAEMHLANLRKIARSLFLIVAIKGLLILTTVTAAVWGLARFIPFLEGQPTGLILSVGMILGVLAIGTSPAATIAVISETGAKGRLADTTLGVAVAKDIVMVVLLALGVALAGTYGPEGEGLGAHLLVDLSKELGLSLFAGGVLGFVIIAYMRYVGWELWLFLIGVIFATTAVAQELHLEVLLTFIVAGFVVQNVSARGHDFVHLVERVALPVFVVFFSAAGAGIQLSALRTIGLVALALVLVRLVAIWLGTGWATRLAGEPEEIRKNAWMAMVAQAGVVIGLSIIVETKLPGLGSEIRTLVMAMVAIHLLLGPVLFKMALGRAGEIPITEAPGDTVAGLETDRPVVALDLAPLAEDLERDVAEVEARVMDAADALAAAAESTAVAAAAALEGEDSGPEQATAKWREALEQDWDRELIEAVDRFWEEVNAAALESARQRGIPLEDFWYEKARWDTGSETWRKRLRRVRRGFRRAAGADPHLRRVVPVRDMVLYHMAHELAGDLRPVLSRAAAQPALRLRRMVLGPQPKSKDPEDEHENGEDPGEVMEPGAIGPILHEAVQERLRRLKRELTVIGTGELPTGKRRPSQRHEDSSRERERARDAIEAWKELALGTVAHVERGAAINDLRDGLSGLATSFEERFRNHWATDLIQPLGRARTVLDETALKVQALPRELSEELERGLAEVGEFVSLELRRKALAGLRRDMEAKPFERQRQKLNTALDELTEVLPENFLVVDPDNLPDPSKPPRSYPDPADYQFQLIARGLVERTIQPSVDSLGRESSEALARAEQFVQDLRERLELRFEVALDAAMDQRQDDLQDGAKDPDTRTNPLGVVKTAIEQAKSDLDDLLASAMEVREQALDRFQTVFDELLEGFGTRLTSARPIEARLQAGLARVELEGGTRLRLLQTQLQQQWADLMIRLGIRSMTATEKEEKGGPLEPAGPAGSDRALVFRILFDQSSFAGRLFDRVLIVVIVASIIVVMMDSVAGLHARFRIPFLTLEWIFTIIFTVEYAGRLWSVNRPTRYAFSFFGVIDLLAVLPTYLTLIVPGGQYLVAIRALRVLRVFRVFKLARYVGEANRLGEGLKASRPRITVFVFSVLIITVVIGSIMFLIEGPAAGFTSIPRGMYWGIVTLTTVGFGDIAPVTPLGQALAAILMITGYGIIVVGAGILGAQVLRGPTAATEERATASRTPVFTCPECSHVEEQAGGSYCRMCGTTV